MKTLDQLKEEFLEHEAGASRWEYQESDTLEIWQWITENFEPKKKNISGSFTYETASDDSNNVTLGFTTNEKL